MEAWNNHYHTSTEINLTAGKVTWTTHEPRPGVELTISTAANGFILSQENFSDNSRTLMVFTSLWDLKSKLDELMIMDIYHEEDFVPDHYSASVIEALNNVD